MVKDGAHHSQVQSAVAEVAKAPGTGALPQKTKACLGCGKAKSYDEFTIDRATSDGYKSHCKSCIAEKRAHKAEEQVEQLSARMDAIGVDALEKFIAQSENATHSGLPHIGTVMQKISDVFGGPEGIASKLYLEFLNSPPGSLQRQRTLLKLMEFTMETSKQGYAKVPFDLLDNEDLEREAAELMKRVANDDPKLIARIMQSAEDAKSTAEAIDGEGEVVE